MHTITCQGEKVELKTTGPFQAPTQCPCCSGTLVTSGRALLCVNDECEGKAFQQIKNWVKKHDIKGLGEGLLLALYERGDCCTIPDLYDLRVQDLATANVGNGILGKSNAERVMAEIDRTRSTTTNLFMGSIGVKFLGRSMAAHIGLAHPTDYLTISEADLAAKDNMGVNKAREMRESVLAKAGLINALLTKVSITEEEKVAVTGDACAGMVMVFTGVRPKADEQAKFESLGGVVKDSVSKNATHLCQKDATSVSSKSQKAISLGLKVIGYADFQAMIA